MSAPEPVRLSKYLAAMLSCSRREAEMYIEGGWVTVDGDVVEESQFKVTDQQVAVLPNAKPEAIEPITFLVHKPEGMSVEAVMSPSFLNAESHFAGDHSRITLRKKHFSKLETPILLGNNTSGILILTQDWRVKRKLTEDYRTLEQEYMVDVNGDLSDACIDALNKTREYQGKPMLPAKFSKQSEQRLRVAIKGPIGSQIPDLLAEYDLTVTKMKLQRIGRIGLSGLPMGQWRYLVGYERF